MLKGQALNQFLRKRQVLLWDSVPIQDVEATDLRNDSFDIFRAGVIEAWGRGIEKIKDSCAEAGNPMPEYTVKKEDIMVTFKSLMADTTQDTTQAVTQGTTQAEVQNIENSIPMRIIKVIKDNPALSQSQIAEMLGEKHDTIKYHMRKMWLSGTIAREGTSQNGKWIIM